MFRPAEITTQKTLKWKITHLRKITFFSQKRSTFGKNNTLLCVCVLYKIYILFFYMSTYLLCNSSANVHFWLILGLHIISGSYALAVRSQSRLSLFYLLMFDHCSTNIQLYCKNRSYCVIEPGSFMPFMFGKLTQLLIKVQNRIQRPFMNQVYCTECDLNV